MSQNTTFSINNLNNRVHDFSIKCQYLKEFSEWIDTRGHSNEHSVRLKAYYTKNFNNKEFNSPMELHTYIQDKQFDINNITKCIRVYLNFCDLFDKLPLNVIAKYRSLLKLKKYHYDNYVPSDEAVITGISKLKRNSPLELLYLVLATSGIRYSEAIMFLSTYDSNQFIVSNNYVSYNVSELRHTKNINNIYLPLFVYKQLKHISNTKHALRQRYNERHVGFSFKYLRKWQYNFLLYNNVPESVADFIQGRASKSIAANHYLAKSQQAGFWYSKIVSNLERVFSNIKPTTKSYTNSQDTVKSQKDKVQNYSEAKK